jgi:hypothetical protein|tara:strand:- start:662 stop:1132 length:471 start_codon:yes stop_codon:yes gene_type:complete
MTEETKNARSSRSSTTREKTTRRTPWKPPSSLDAPPAPEGYRHRWVRTNIMGTDDTKNLSARLREGFDLVRADEYPDFHAPTIQDGKHAGVIGVGGLVLARFPIESQEERDAYFRAKTEGQQEAIDNDMLREQHPSMPISKPERQSRVTFGGKAAE